MTDQQLPQGLRMGDCGASPRVFSGGRSVHVPGLSPQAAPAATAAALRVPDARCRSKGRSGRRRRRRGRREEGGTAQAARLRDPHLLAGARPLPGSLWSAGRSSRPRGLRGSANPQLPLQLPPRTRAWPPPPVTSAETGRGRRQSRGEGGQMDRRPGTRTHAKNREMG